MRLAVHGRRVVTQRPLSKIVRDDLVELAASCAQGRRSDKLS